jgi:hypothetical protein
LELGRAEETYDILGCSSEGAENINLFLHPFYIQIGFRVVWLRRLQESSRTFAATEVLDCWHPAEADSRHAGFRCHFAIREAACIDRENQLHREEAYTSAPTRDVEDTYLSTLQRKAVKEAIGWPMTFFGNYGPECREGADIDCAGVLECAASQGQAQTFG